MTGELTLSPPIESELSRLSSLGNAALRDELVRCMSDTASHLLRLAAIIRVLEERGENLSDLKIGMVRHLRRIAYGQILPEVVVRFGSSTMLIDKIGSLPLPDQRRIASGEPIKLLVGRGDHRMVDPLNMTQDQVRQAFGKDHIRDDAEQAAFLDSPDRRRPGRKSLRVGRVRPDRERMGLIVGRAFAPIDDVLAGLRGLRDVDETDEDGEEKTVAIKLTASEHRRLRMAAAKIDTSMADLVHRALEAAGLI